MSTTNNTRTPEDKERLRKIRDQIQAEKPTLDQLLKENNHTVPLTLGEYLSIREIAAAMRREREHQGLTLAEVSEKTGIDVGAISRIESGKADNPTIETLLRLASGLGKRIVCSLVDLHAGKSETV